MCELYALSARTPVVPRADLNVLQAHARPPFNNVAGWGVCWSGNDGPVLQKAPEPALRGGDYAAIAKTAPASRSWLVHLRAASSGGVSLANTQPYLFDLDGGQAVFAHNGELTDITDNPEFRAHADEREGDADSECAMIILKYRLRAAVSATARWDIFRVFSAEMRSYGPANFLVRIGDDLFAHADRRKPVGTDELREPGLMLLETDGAVRLSSEPLAKGYVDLARGEMIWARNGEVLDRIR